MVSVVPMKRKLMDVKIGKLGSWILMQEFVPKGTCLESFREVTTNITSMSMRRKGALLSFLWWQLMCCSIFLTRNSNNSG